MPTPLEFSRYPLNDVPSFQSAFLQVRNEVPCRRLVVFMHGFGGNCVSTWKHFENAHKMDPWWMDADLLFLGYTSTKRDPQGVAYALKNLLPQVYPQLPASWVARAGRSVNGEAQYEELYLVGHSLGGVIVRRAIATATEEWEKGDLAELPRWLADARLRLFAPATGGFDPARSLGALRAALPTWAAIAIKSQSRALQDLWDPESELLSGTHAETVRLADSHPSIAALVSVTLWADDDAVVRRLDYGDDVHHWQPGVSHKKVCKPNETNRHPLQLVATGAIDLKIA
jgi:alpha-beta hydrolase superfamily lysophospholipase